MPASTSATWRHSIARALAGKLAGNVQEAAEIAGEHAIGAGLHDIAGLGLDDGIGDVGIFDREGAAEAAAHFRLLHLGQGEAGDARKETPRGIAHLELAQGSSRNRDR